MGMTKIFINRTTLSIALAPAMTIPFISSLFYFVILGEHATSRFVYGGAKLFTLVWPVLCIFLLFRTGFPNLNLRSKKHTRALPLGLFSGILIVTAMLFLMKTPVGGVVIDGAENIRKKTEQLGVMDHYWHFSIALSILHSLLEEYYWRWFVYGSLRKLFGVLTAIVLAGIFFAAHHLVVLTQFFSLQWAFFFSSAVAIGGMIWSLMFEKQQTLMGAWISHMLVDFGIFIIGYQVLY